MKRLLLIVTMLLLVLSVGSAGWGQKPLSVIGKSEQSEKVPNPTLDMAIKDGLTKAVAEVVGSMVSPQDIQKKQELLSKEFLQNTEPYILSYSITDKTVLPTGYQAALEVLVDTKGVEKRLAALGLLRERDEGSRLREVRLTISGVTSYQSYVAIERLLAEDTEVQDFVLAEMGSTLFIWRVMMRGDTGRLTARFLAADFDGLKTRVITAERERVELGLSR
jgi:hypothetical protein